MDAAVSLTDDTSTWVSPLTALTEAAICTIEVVVCSVEVAISWACLLYTSDAADERSSVDLGGRRIIKKKTIIHHSVY